MSVVSHTGKMMNAGCPARRGGQTPRSTAEIPHSLAWVVGLLALLPVCSGFDLFRAASQNPTAESDGPTGGRRLGEAQACDAQCDGCKCDSWYVWGICYTSSCGCDSEDENRKICDHECDEGCLSCASFAFWDSVGNMRSLVGSVGECYNKGDGNNYATEGQCCKCDQVYVRNLSPESWTNPQAAKEGVYTRAVGFPRAVGRESVTTPSIRTPLLLSTIGTASGFWAVFQMH